MLASQEKLYVAEDRVEIQISLPFVCLKAVAYPGIFSGGRVQQIKLRIEDRENGDLGA